MSRGCKRLGGVKERDEKEAGCSAKKAGKRWAEKVEKGSTAWSERSRTAVEAKVSEWALAGIEETERRKLAETVEARRRLAVRMVEQRKEA